jgi:hypothetical protein
MAAFGPHGFLAFVEPLGQCRSFSSELRAEAVRVISIAAYETPNRIGAYRTLYRTGNVTWLTEGLLREGRLNTGLEPGTLLPVRAGEDRRPGAMRFSVRDGAVTFTED